MPPEKKKKFSQHSENSADVESSTSYEKDDSNAGPQRSSSTREAIKFDEYMEGGIPDSLLKGLGFSESGQPGIDEGSDPEGEAATPDSSLLHKDPTDDEAEDEDEAVTQDDDDDYDYEERVPPKAVVKRKPGRPPGKAVPKAAQRPSRDYHSGVKSSKAIIRGNIMYERMETGEVVASLIKNGLGDNDGARSTPDRTGGYSMQARNFGAVLNDLPSNCPIDENNVEDVLDRSIEETDVVRMALAALKDDLRRMGGGPHMTPYLKPVHVKKRIEIAERLLKVYCNYQTNINNISEMSRNPLSHVFPGNWTPVERARPVAHTTRAPRRGRGTRRAVRMEHSAHSVGSPDVTLPSVVKREPLNSAGAVSNDLWMSCEPGSEDEGTGQVGAMRKHKRQSRDKASVDVQIN